ncbi:hypothetical protein [Pseudovibrio sp. WM33]|uniref:hypothetical protein n=1 Tax=Pseudovibrio sp. WM33 TaxID=1735585 RepID=UPI0007B17B23|nr:hypothetical protein [Pseudovibrio sp. WM33]KZL24688.1 hypothetical protein PsWM33_02362 [Pseudovibrio sp. WM33]
MIAHSKFDTQKFNTMVCAYRESGMPGDYPEVSDYEEYCAKYPLSERDNLRAMSERVVEKQEFADSYVVTTSGTTQAPLVLVNRIWQDTSDNTYPKQLFDYLIEHVFAQGDVVANLCFPGGLGLLYEGMCKILEPMGCTVLPVGRLDSLTNDYTHFELFERLRLNTLVGSPCDLIAFAKTAQKYNINLPIKKLVYAGEHFYPAKRDLVKSIWPEADFYSLYGATEFGLACVGHPNLSASHHYVFEDWFFLETDEDGNLYVTDLKGPLIPIIRYKIGDRGTLVTGEGGSTQLALYGRSDSFFNLGDAMLRYEAVCETIRSATLPDMARNAEIQLHLHSATDGKDVLTVVLDHDFPENGEVSRGVWEAVHSMKDIRWDVGRGVVELRVRDRASIHITNRSKRPDIVDLRDNATMGKELESA